MVTKTLEGIRAYETNLYSREAVLDVSADSQIGYELDWGWFAGRKLEAKQSPYRVNEDLPSRLDLLKGLDLTPEEADWFVNC